MSRKLSFDIRCSLFNIRNFPAVIVAGCFFCSLFTDYYSPFPMTLGFFLTFLPCRIGTVRLSRHNKVQGSRLLLTHVYLFLQSSIRAFNFRFFTTLAFISMTLLTELCMVTLNSLLYASRLPPLRCLIKTMAMFVGYLSPRHPKAPFLRRLGVVLRWTW